MTLSGYIQLAMEQAHYKILEDRTIFGEIQGFPGVWANEKSVEKCRQVLQEVLEEWLILQLRDGHSVPRFNGKGLSVPVHTHQRRSRSAVRA